VLVVVSVDTNHKGGDVATLGGGSDQHLLGTSLWIGRGKRAGKEPGSTAGQTSRTVRKQYSNYICRKGSGY
jgi:hypothetical protein